MGSVRTSPELEEKIRRVAGRKGITRSELFRRALENYCDQELAPSQKSRYDDVSGIVEGPRDGSVRVTEYFVEELMEKHG